MNDAPIWPASAIEMRDPAALKPNPENPRRHSPGQIENIRAAIDEFGWTVPCVIDEDDLVWGGHGRRLAALLDPPIERIPVVVARGWTAEQKVGYMLAENRIAETSEWDPDLLRKQLEAIRSQFDLSISGFDAVALPQFLARPNAGLIDPDTPAPEPKKNPAVRPGDLWQLGTHRLLCGDATSKEAVARLLGAVKPNLMVTDPPYGVEYDPAWRTKAGVGSKGAATGQVLNDDRADWSEAWQLFPGNVAYVWHGGLHGGTVQASLETCGFKLYAQIIWFKARAALSRGHYHWEHEPAFYVKRPGEDDGWRQFGEDHETAAYAVRKGGTGAWSGGRKQTTAWFIDHVKNDTGHGTQKPVECMQRPMENNSKPGDAIYEPFCGSGTTIIAGERSGRAVLAMELSPAYVQVAIERWELFSGKKATLDGHLLADVIKARAAGKPLGRATRPGNSRRTTRQAKA